eukprot:CAMPEP_0196587908 /NCGR_PEP_ID=MMETSP1081-20130531/58984_1 /TAXON_ID=36882 /ORGANISM="Pyramimonas amylifera, Strain CCMP720" /LENGTH=271 /DNA_ID=CAMNT_0041910239 /DNA_START=201 /DNA_END=1016 /DNA_ORIENTATION=-
MTRSTFTIAAQVVPGLISAKSLLSHDMLYESVVTATASAVSLVFHSCDEMLWCPTKNEHIWRLLDSFCFFTMLTSAAMIPAGCSPLIQGVVCFMSACLTAFVLLSPWAASFPAQALLYFAPLAFVKATWAVAGTHRGCRTDVLVSAAGLLVPGLLCHLTAVNTGVGEEFGKNVLRRTRNMPPTPQFWLFHGLWHLASTISMFLVYTCRVERPTVERRNDANIKRPRRRAVSRHWLSVLLRHYMLNSSSIRPGDKPIGNANQGNKTNVKKDK